jgi:hypothetical protein
MEPEVAAEIVDSLKAVGIDFIPRRAGQTDLAARLRAAGVSPTSSPPRQRLSSRNLQALHHQR